EDRERALAIEHVAGDEEHVDVEVRRVGREPERLERRREPALARGGDAEHALRRPPAPPRDLTDVLAARAPPERGVQMTVLALGPPAHVLVRELELELVTVHRRARQRRQDQDLHLRRRVTTARHYSSLTEKRLSLTIL